MVFLLIVLGTTAWVGVRALMAKGEIERAVPLASSIQSDILAGDGNRTSESFRQLSDHSQKAAALTSDPVWRAFELIPFLGPNLSAFREMAQVVDDVSEGAIRPLAELAGTMNVDSFQPVDGSVDLQPLIAAQPRIAAASAALDRARDDVNGIDTSATLASIRGAATELQIVVNDAANTIGAADKAVQLVPAMLGADGPRNYLLLFQNNAELRATGGLPGALAQIGTDSGRIELVKQDVASAFPHYQEPVLELPKETRGLFSDRVSTYFGDITLTPHFATTGQLVFEMWKNKYGTELDGVISIDPIALSYLLRATGPITLATGDVLTSDNAVQLLLRDVYSIYDEPIEQDAFFAATASAVFDALSSGQADPALLIDALAQGGVERRLLLWSAHEEDQKLLAGTTLAGELPMSDDRAESFGVYFNDGTGAKMDTFLDVQIGLGETTCREDGRPYYAVDVTLSNTAPADAATSLPESVTGPGTYGVKQGNVKTLILVYGPKDAQNVGVTRDGERIAYHPAADSGYPVSQTAVELAPGESSTTRVYLLGGSKDHGELVAVSTPVIHLNETEPLQFPCEAVPE